MQHLTPKEAYEFLKARPDAVFVDCRSDAEFFLVGHSLVDRPGQEPLRPHNICWSDELKLETNPLFVEQIEQIAQPKTRPVVIICRSGRRSVAAGHALEAAGYPDVYNVLHGFEGELDENFQRGRQAGWRHDGLPWEQL
ncbi:MAG TPA: rhodanese-like domain-containing protein [Burkholderiaceae bacterium]|jgi:rhodanese-related sulfurtransferase|nr:rhodanese-like domain-containing protein [Burkholderiaceae bacterium]